jgi:transposase
VSEPDVPSYAQLLALIEQLRLDNARLVERVTELEARLAQNSKNSSKPPSSDGLAKPAPKSRRGRSGRRPGGQSGHPGRTLEQVETPDEVRRYEPAACGGCGGDLAGSAQTGIVRRQVFDIPQTPVRVVEHQLIQRRCGCGVTTCGPAPGGVDAPVQYGARITAILIYLYAGQFLSKQRTAQALSELFGVPISAGTVAAASSRAARDVTGSGFLDRVRDRIAASSVAHFDETGFRVAGKLHWVHSASTGKYSLITVHPKRGTVAMNAGGVLPVFTGIAVHDAWAPYDTYTQAGHALCGAHVLRELTAVIDTARADAFCWARQAHDALLGLKKLVDDAAETGHTFVDPHALAHHTHLLRSAANIGATSNRHRDTLLAKKHHALARRLLDRQGDYLRFTTNFSVPFDNNAAEREIRMIKIRQKVSGCLRTLTGAETFCAIRSYLATAAKHGINFFTSLTMLAERQPWLPTAA